MKNSSPERFLFLDALRGMAAGGVVLNHAVFANQLSPILERSLPAIYLVIAHLTVAGVWIFFVLSGFIIAHSLRNDALTNASIGRFILRRHARLDPPYWAALALMMAVRIIEGKLLGSSDSGFFTLKTLISNMFYLQNLSKVEPILIVGWTLCIEVQFYLFFIGILYASKLADRNKTYGFEENAGHLVFFTGIISVVSWATPFKSVIWSQSLFVTYWNLFAAGVLAYWAYSRFIDRRLFFIYFAIFTAALISRLAITGKWGVYSPQITADLTMLGLYLAGAHSKMGSWLNFSLLRYLGRLSYSLYLIHLPVFILLFALIKTLHLTTATTILLWLSCLPLTVFVSHLWWRFIETPSLKLSNRFKVRANINSVEGTH